MYYEISDAQIDPFRRVVTRGGCQINLQPRCLDVLILLLENSGRIVSKDDFIARLWPRGDGSDAALSQHVFVIRRALGFSKDSPISTIAGRGYRIDHSRRISDVPKAPTRRRISAHNPSARAAFFFGLARHCGERGDHASLNQAISYYRLALAEDPSFAPAHVGMADVHSTLGSFLFVPSHLAYSAAEVSAQNALSLDETSLEALVCLGDIFFHYHGDYSVAEQHFLRALEIDPANPMARHCYGWLKLATGLEREALRDFKVALANEPSSTIYRINIAKWHLYRADYDSAIRAFEDILKVEPAHEIALLNLGVAFLHSGRSKHAIPVLRRADPSHRSDPVSCALAAAYINVGDPTYAIELINQLKLAKRNRFVASYNVAKIYAALGETTIAKQFLNRSLKDSRPQVPFLGIDPWFADVRPDILKVS